MSNEKQETKPKQTELFTRRAQQLRLRDGVQFDSGLGCQPVTLKAVLVAVDSFAGETGWCFACHENMAKRANVSERTLRNALVILGDEGLLRKQKRRTHDGFWQCRYQIFWASVQAYIEAYRERIASQKLDETPKPDEWVEVYDFGPTANEGIPNGKSCRRPTANGSGGQRQMATDPAANGDRPNGKSCRITTPLSASDPPPPNQNDSVEVEILDSVVSLLMTRMDSPTEASRLAAGIDLDQARDLITEFDFAVRQGQLSSPGAIAYRIKNGRWPAPKIKPAAEIRSINEAKKRRLAIQKQQNAAKTAVLEAERLRNSSIDGKFGTVLDQMPDGDRLRFARNCLTECEFELYRRNPKIFRYQLLEAMEKSCELHRTVL